MRLIKKCGQWFPKDDFKKLPKGVRGIYALLDKSGKDRYDVVYIGMAWSDERGIKSRLAGHRRSEGKGPKWTHFSVFEVFDNLTQAEIRSLEGIVPGDLSEGAPRESSE